MNIDTQYKTLLKTILANGSDQVERTGVGCRSIWGHMLKCDMSVGFPALTLRKIPFRSVRVELEGFIRGMNSKKWYQDRGCKFWDEWCNPQKVPYNNSPETKEKMLKEDDLGIIYPNNWRAFHDPGAYEEIEYGWGQSDGKSFKGKVVDQFANLLKELKTNPNSRRMYVGAWNPLALKHAALPSCHDSWTVSVMDGRLNLSWRQRSVDTILGLPNNIAFYGTLLHLLALESGYKEGFLVGHLDHCHIYHNGIDAANEYISRNYYADPTIITENFDGILNWTHDQTKLEGYKAHPRIQVDVAV